jgi:Sulfite exporter TauE/SafE
MPRLVETIPTPAISNGLSPTGGGPAVSPTVIATAIHVVAAAGLGGMAGLLGGLFGVGGGFLVIPLLGFFYGMDQQTAQGTALIMVVPKRKHSLIGGSLWPALLAGKMVDQRADEGAELGGHVPAMRIERDDLELRRLIVGQQRHQRSKGKQIEDQVRGRQPQSDAGDGGGAQCLAIGGDQVS